MARTRAFSLLELLIALTLLVALASLALPSVLNTLAEHTFESSADAVRNQLLLARAHTQATGLPVEVIWRRDEARLEARLFHIGEEETPELTSDLDGDFEQDQLPRDEVESRAIVEPWAIRELPVNVRISLVMPEAARAAEENELLPPADDAIDDAFLEEEDDEPPAIVRLAVFLADGSALLSEPRWLSDDDGRWARIAVHPLLGLPAVELNARAAEEVPASDESTEDEDAESKDEPEAAVPGPEDSETSRASDPIDDEENETP